jgi:hypothetical protein
MFTQNDRSFGVKARDGHSRWVTSIVQQNVCHILNQILLQPEKKLVIQAVLFLQSPQVYDSTPSNETTPNWQ